jgi:drug/metabolite transporter (DMT)-like permease
LIWGGTFVAAKLVLQSMGAFSGAFLRFAIASVALGIWCWQREGGLPRLSPRQWGWVSLMGFSGVFAYNIFFFLGLQSVPAGRGALLVAQNPIAIAICSTLLFGEPMSKLKLVGIITSFIGAAIVIARGDVAQLLNQGIGIGEVYLLAAVGCWVVYTLAVKQGLKYVPLAAANTYACGIGALGLLLPALGEGILYKWPTYQLNAWLAVAYSGIFASALAFVWYSQGIECLGAGRASIFINLVPPSAVLFSAWILHEPITPSLVLGGALIITGVVLTNRPVTHHAQNIMHRMR